MHFLLHFGTELVVFVHFQKLVPRLHHLSLGDEFTVNPWGVLFAEVDELLVVLQALDEIPLNPGEDIDDPTDVRPTSFADMLEAAGELTNRNTLKDLE